MKFEFEDFFHKKLPIEKPTFDNSKKRVENQSQYQIGFQAGRKSVLGNFDATGPITAQDFEHIKQVLRKGGFELVFNPYKEGFDIRRPLYSDAIEVEIKEIEEQ